MSLKKEASSLFFPQQLKGDAAAAGASVSRSDRVSL